MGLKNLVLKGAKYEAKMRLKNPLEP
jgi:hypothetical protein